MAVSRCRSSQTSSPPAKPRPNWARISRLGCAGGWFHVMRMPNVYESSARLYIDSDAILTPLLRGLTVEPSLGAQLDLLARTLLSRPNLEKLISKTDLELQVNTPAERVAL